MAQNLTTTTGGEVERLNGENARRPIYRPATDIFETDDHVVLVADMPGVGPDDVEVTLERRVLTIRGYAHPPAPEGYRQVYGEYGTGDYERVFTLTDDIDQDDIRATTGHGVLRLELPKAASAKPRRIEVKAA
ncbi:MULTISPECIES: Hsp20/alpha crystallin family protein [unclassified Roseitalea]|uniref:Hsp20/alpha crystallin family protein n=1 Tax=unclassified Roseitalea TaxID=2639107 RepID=UPI00273D07A3|nr:MULTISPECIES: Hsp20/alpha crystallin family protein [unclassified Roseitalea]